MNLSLEVKSYPRTWKVARVKPLFKGEGCDRHAPKSYRPVALLSAISRIMEAILAKQLDQYQEINGLIHKGVHGGAPYVNSLFNERESEYTLRRQHSNNGKQSIRSNGPKV